MTSFNKKTSYYLFSFFKYDLKASVTVFFVALPLCLGVALASGTPLMSGLVAGVIGGIVVPPYRYSRSTSNGVSLANVSCLRAGIYTQKAFLKNAVPFRIDRMVCLCFPSYSYTIRKPLQKRFA